MALFSLFLLCFILSVSNGQSTPQVFNVSNLRDTDWTQVDRRAQDGWFHLYPFGEKFHDRDISGRPWNDQQIDLDYYIPYYGFRFNYTFIYQEGFVAFSFPQYIQPPYTFPNPKWPAQADPAIIAAYMTPQTLSHIGEHQISHLWYRVVLQKAPIGNDFGHFHPNAVNDGNRTYNGQRLRTQEGRMEDPEFLNQITNDIREGYVGARGFTAKYALVVTWERMAYGGAPKVTRLNMYDQVRRWQNTYQMVIATDEARSFVIFNYAHLNTTSSTGAGILVGRGGKQSALVGFNGGNGTGFSELPYSAEGNNYKLVQFGSSNTAGRWIVRVDEEITYGGCTNATIGRLQTHTKYVSMLGGSFLNVSGPCFKPTHFVKLQLDEITVDCQMMDMVIAKCFIPVGIARTSGLVDVKLSIDGGRTYPFWNTVYIVLPSLENHVRLLDDPLNPNNSWDSANAATLTLKWPRLNLTADRRSVDIELWGYRETVSQYWFKKVGTIARQIPNTGLYMFDPRHLMKNEMPANASKHFRGGVIRVGVPDWLDVVGDANYWSKPTSFAWFFKDIWQRDHGDEWAKELCTEWSDYDGLREDITPLLETPQLSCPCVLSQALGDFGRFTPLRDCDMSGNKECRYTKGAQHCVISTGSAFNSASQMCCYDNQGYLMFSDDYEYNPQYLRYYGAGVPYRAHPWGGYPYKRPPYVPGFSNFANDLLPYEFCCKLAGKCELFYERRHSSTCKRYVPAQLAIAYGDPHFITFDGVKYSFQGKGYYVLSMMKSPQHDLIIQARFEQPPKTMFDTEVPATVITGVALRDNGSSVVQVFARKSFRRWRYKIDLYVDGHRIFQDKWQQKLHRFRGVSIVAPTHVWNMSEIVVMFDTGVGVRIHESHGMLSVAVALPPSYNQTRRNPVTLDLHRSSGKKCSQFYRTGGLLGVWNGDRNDEFTSPSCITTSVPSALYKRPYPAQLRQIHESFGEKWRLDGTTYPLLFQTKFRPLYNPRQFANSSYEPSYNINNISADLSSYQSLLFTRDQVKIQCQGVPSCEYDYITTGRREIALNTLSIERKFAGLKRRSERKYVSCGPLPKPEGTLKYPQGNNYLDGVTVRRQCLPSVRFCAYNDVHRCVNGTWQSNSTTPNAIGRIYNFLRLRAKNFLEELKELTEG